jgi:hypothetical protein
MSSARDGAAGAGSKDDAVELVWQQLRFQQRLAQGMPAGIAPYRGLDALLEEASVDVFFCIGINDDGHACRLEPPHTPEQAGEIGDRPAAERAGDGLRVGVEAIRQQHPQLELRAVAKMHCEVAWPVGRVAHGCGESPAHLVERVDDVLAGAERVLAEVRARAVRLAGLPPPESDPVGFP